MISERAFKMNFEEFQNQSRLYVVGALESEEVEEFEREREKFGKKAQDFLTQCYALHEAFALSLRSLKASAAIKEQLMSMVRQRKQVTYAENAAAVALTARTVRLIRFRGVRQSRNRVLPKAAFRSRQFLQSK